jgi:hypothetical protein
VALVELDRSAELCDGVLVGEAQDNLVEGQSGERPREELPVTGLLCEGSRRPARLECQVIPAQVPLPELAQYERLGAAAAIRSGLVQRLFDEGRDTINGSDLVHRELGTQQKRLRAQRPFAENRIGLLQQQTRSPAVASHQQDAPRVHDPRHAGLTLIGRRHRDGLLEQRCRGSRRAARLGSPPCVVKQGGQCWILAPRRQAAMACPLLDVCRYLRQTSMPMPPAVVVGLRVRRRCQ